MGTAKRERQKLNRAARQVVDARHRRNDLIKRRITKWGLIAVVIVGGVFILAQVTKDDKKTGTTTTVAGDTTSTVAGETTTTSATVPTATTAPGASITGDTPCPATDGSAARTITFENAPPMCIDATKTYTATFDTTEGKIVVELDTTNTPNTVNNFVTLSRYKYFDSSLFFRTDPSIDIIQGGGQDNSGGPGYTIKDEGSGYTYAEGDLVMARTSAPDSAGGQFFFVTGPNAAALNSQGTYVVFGHVTEGMDVLKTVIGLHVDLNNGLGGAPSRTVTVNSVTITES